MPQTQTNDFIVLGGGIAGLTFAREMTRKGKRVAVIEKEKRVGGLSRTFVFDDYRFDIGGHRLVSPWPHVIDWTKDLMGGDLLDVARTSRIHLNGRYIKYPLELPNALAAFSPGRAVRIFFSYLKAASRKQSQADNASFETWVVSRFGRALYDVYFRPYTEKVWGVPCTELAADHAIQRIRIPSLTAAVKGSLLRYTARQGTLASRFYYPPLGFGAIPDRMAEQAESTGFAEIHLESRVTRLDYDEASAGWRADCRRGGHELTVTGRQIVSTIPIGSLLSVLPRADASLPSLADALQYRGMMCVFLALEGPKISDDTWTYFPDSTVNFGRTHEPPNWSPKMVPEGDTSLVAEIFCSPGEAGWDRPDEDLIGQTVDDLVRINWVQPKRVRGAWLTRFPNAYPIYRIGYREEMQKVHGALARWPTLHLTGRTGSFQYLNADAVIKQVLQLVDDLSGEL